MSNNSQEGETYGFGLQFQQSRQSHFYQQLVDAGLPMQSPPEMQPGHNQGYGTANHDQVKMPKKVAKMAKKGQKYKIS